MDMNNNKQMYLMKKLTVLNLRKTKYKY